MAVKQSQIQVHGGRVYEAAKLLGRSWSEIIDFSANINPLGQPRGLKEALFADFERSLHYPEVRAESLTTTLAEMTGLSSAHFLPGAGSTPHLHILARALKMTKPVIIGPAFAEYEAALTRAAVMAQYVITREQNDWLVTQDTLTEVFKKSPDAIFIANPANPTGRQVPGDLLIELAEECRRREIWLVVDEAFIDFTENGRSLVHLVEKNQRLIILRSMTKIFAIPGLRLAFLAAHPKTMDLMLPLVEPWSLSSQAVTAGHYCLSRVGFKDNAIKGVRIFKHYLTRELADLNLGRIFPSEANFILFRLRGQIKPKVLIEHLFQDGILVRDASNFQGLRTGYLRLAVRPVEDVATLMKSLRRFKAATNA